MNYIIRIITTIAYTLCIGMSYLSATYLTEKLLGGTGVSKSAEGFFFFLLGMIGLGAVFILGWRAGLYKNWKRGAQENQETPKS